MVQSFLVRGDQSLYPNHMRAIVRVRVSVRVGVMAKLGVRLLCKLRTMVQSFLVRGDQRLYPDVRKK